MTTSGGTHGRTSGGRHGTGLHARARAASSSHSDADVEDGARAPGAADREKERLWASNGCCCLRQRSRQTLGTSRREEAARVEAEKNLGRGRDLWIEEEQWRAMVGWWLKLRRGGFGSGKIPRWKERPSGVAAR